MALELEGKPFKLEAKDNKKYSTKMVFRVGKQYIRVNFLDPDMKPVEVAPVHVVTEYQHHAMESGLRARRGRLVYFESKVYNQESKREDYSPARISIGYPGYITSTDPELNYFLDNHPSNEIVREDADHPNWKDKGETYFATYRKDKNRDVLESQLQATADLTQMFLNKQKMGEADLKAIAMLVVRSANDYHIAHKLYNIEEFTAADLRVELARLSALYPIPMKKITESKQVDYIKEVNRFKDIGLVKVVNNDWVESDGANLGKVIMRIPQNADHDKALAEWFKKYDRKGDSFRDLQEKAAKIEELLEKA